MLHDPDWVRPKNMRGCSNAQFFTEVSPEMHREFTVEHDLQRPARWGPSY